MNTKTHTFINSTDLKLQKHKNKFENMKLSCKTELKHNLSLKTMPMKAKITLI